MLAVRGPAAGRPRAGETERLVVRLQRAPAPVADPEEPASDADPAPPEEGVAPRGGHRGPGRLTRLAASVGDRLPATLRGGRLALDGTAALGLGVVGLVAVVVAALIWWEGRPQAVAVPAMSPPAAVAGVAPATAPATESPVPAPAAKASVAGSASAPVAASAVPSPGGVVVVDVAGRVRHPGVIRLPVGSRVVDALHAAGGARPGTDLASINLARPLVDGEQVLVGRVQGAVPPGVSPPAGGPAATDAVLDLNTATAEQLQELPEIGEVLAQRIIDWRTEHGRFSTTDELQEVSGIGPRTFDALQDLVRV